MSSVTQYINILPITFNFFKKSQDFGKHFSLSFLWTHFQLWLCYCSSIFFKLFQPSYFSAFLPFQLFKSFFFLFLHVKGDISHPISKSVLLWPGWILWIFFNISQVNQCAWQSGSTQTPKSKYSKMGRLCCEHCVWAQRWHHPVFRNHHGSLSLPFCRKLEGLWGYLRMILSASSWNYFIALRLVWTFSSAWEANHRLSLCPGNHAAVHTVFLTSAYIIYIQQ